MSKLPANAPAKVEICNTLDGQQFVPIVIDLSGVNTRRRSIKTLLAALTVEPETPSRSESDPRAGFDDVPAMLRSVGRSRSTKKSNAE